MSELRWPDLSAHGIRLRAAAREGDAPLLVAMPAVGFDRIPEPAHAGLVALGFEAVAGTPTWRRPMANVQVGAIRAAFGGHVEVEHVSRAELFSAPWPVPMDPLGRLQARLDGRESHPEDDAFTSETIAAIKSVAGRVEESVVEFWARWSGELRFGDWPSLDAAGLAGWMDQRLHPMRLAEYPEAGEERMPVVDPPVRTYTSMTTAFSRWAGDIAPFEKRLDRLEGQAVDVENLLGETERVRSARASIAVSRAQIAQIRSEAQADIDDLRTDEHAMELARFTRWTPESVEVPSPALLGLHRKAVHRWFPATYEGRQIWGHEHFVDLEQGSRFRTWLEGSGGQEPSEGGEEASRYASVLDRAHRYAGRAMDRAVPSDARNVFEAVAAFDARAGGLRPLAAPAQAVILRGANGQTIGLNKAYHDYFVSQYPGGEWRMTWEHDVKTLRSGTAAYVRDGKTLGVVATTSVLQEVWESFRDAMSRPLRDPPAPDALAVERRACSRLDTEDGIFFGLPDNIEFRVGPLFDLCGAWVERPTEGNRDHVARCLPERTVILTGTRSEAEAAAASDLAQAAVGEAEIWKSGTGGDRRWRAIVPATPARRRAYPAFFAPVADDAAFSFESSDGESWDCIGAGLREALRPLLSEAIRVSFVDTAQSDQNEPVDGEDGEHAEAESEAAEGLQGSASAAGRRRALAESTRIEDFGEHIGGARKDLAALQGRGLRPTDTSAWNTDERKNLITKDRIWPAPDYRAWVDAGMEPVVAFAVKSVRDAIRSSYTIARRNRRYAWDEKSAAQWFATVADAAERFGAVRSRADLEAVANHYLAAAGQDRHARVSTREAASELEDTFRRERRRHVGNPIWNVLADVMMEPARGWERIDMRRVAAKWPPAESPARRPRAAREEPEIRPQLKGIERIGEDYRGGEDVTTEQFAQTFGLRGGEWGNWQSQVDRQQTLNHAFDALHDLAHVLGVPPAAVSLNGELAVAFGARGKGGRRAAAAHYEPYRRVINLTKLAGAGSLAHEFAHAFDDYLARMSPPAAYASQWAANGKLYPSDKLRPEIVRAIGRIVEVMFKRPVTDDEIRRGRERTLHGYRLLLENGQPRTVDVWKGMLEAVTDLRELDALARSRLHEHVGLLRDAHVASIRGTPMTSKEIGEQLRSALEKAGFAWGVAQRRLGTRLSDVLSVADYFCNAKECFDTAQAACNKPLPPLETRPTRDTDYHLAARNLDSGRSKSYYATTIEMFARAFESYAFDRLAAQGRRSDYLVHGVEPTRYATMPDAQSAEALDTMRRLSKNPYPSGSDRERINTAFDALVGVLKTEVTAQNAVRLYSRGSGDDEPGLSIAAVEAHVAPMRARLEGRVAVRVVATPADLPMPGPASVRGAFTPLPPTAWLVASRLPDADAIEDALAHEVTRHAGLWSLLGNRREATLIAIWADNLEIRARADALQAVAFAEGAPLSRADAVEESLAQFADEGHLPGLEGWSRIVAVVRAVLRDLGFARLAGRWGADDLALLMGRAEMGAPMPSRASDAARAAMVSDQECAPVLRTRAMTMGA